MRHLETVTGTGRARDEEGNDCGETRYEIDVYQEVKASGEPGLMRVFGFVRDLDTFDLLRKKLILGLEDGRSLPFSITDDTGAISARGSLE